MLEDVQFNSLRMGAEMRRSDASLLFAMLAAAAFPGLVIWAALRQ
jgi:hypothetical protein